MKVQIDNLLGLLKTPDYPVSPLLPQRQERILNMTKDKIKAQKSGRRTRRPVRIAAFAAAIVALLCGTAFAAYEFQLFDFSRLFGENTSIIEEAVVTYESESAEVISAQTGLNETNYATLEDYNFKLRGNVEITDTLISASFEVSTVSDGIPKFSTTGMTIEIEGYETEHYIRWSTVTECINVYAQLDAPLDADANIRFLVNDGTASQLMLEDAPMEWSEAQTVLFTEHDPEADYVVDTVSMTGTTISLTGHFQKEFDNYTAALDASGNYILDSGFAWPLYDLKLEDFDPANAKEDLEGYLTIREVTDEGDFTLQWSMTKGIPGYGILIFDSERYEIPEPETSEETPAEYVPTLGTSAETQDYRFTLESIVATGNVIYAVMDMEPITDYGAAHMDLSPEELTIVCSNITHPVSGTVGCSLIESGESMNRYLVYCVDTADSVNEVGDMIHFEILSLLEEGDTAEHSYFLFDAELSQIVPASAEAVQVSENGDGLVHFSTVTLTPLSIYMSGTYDPNADTGLLHANDAACEDPEIILTFKDGTSVTLMDESWNGPMDISSLGEYGIAAIATTGDHTGASGTVSHTCLFSQIIALEEIDSVTIDGVKYQVNYEIG